MDWLRTPPSRSATIARDGAAALISVLAAVVSTWPLAVHSTDHILAAIYHWDAYTNAMIMGGRVDAALGHGPLTLYDDYFFAPLPNTIAFNENLFGLSLLFAPFYLISDNPLWAYNMTLLSSMAASCFFTYLLVKRLTQSGLSGILAGVAFAFCPYVMFEVGRIQLAATQWIPACFLFLHRAMAGSRRRDIVGLWTCYVLQIGTCLYYAMFLVPLLGAAAVMLYFRHRTPLRQLLRFGLGGLAAGAVAFAMVYPYFASRENFALERTLSFASSYDGKLSFFGNVHETNLTWTPLHHRGEYRGAHEEIAFPGLTVALLAVLALVVPVWRYVRVAGVKASLLRARSWLIHGLTFLSVTLLSHSVLLGLAVVGVTTWLQLRRETERPAFGARELHFAVFVLAVAMFLGLEPLQFRGAPVHGLYYYFHTYFPGFNGIRKVSRQAVMTTFTLVAVAGFGCQWLLSKLPRTRTRYATFVALLASVVIELRTFPHPLREVWAGDKVPSAYDYMSHLPSEHLVASFPQNTGQRLFRGDHGLALHNYLMLYHEHRSLNGQSSWEPAVTNLVNHALAHLPSDGARRILESVGMRHLLIHGAELDARDRNLPELLRALPDHYQQVYRDGDDYVFSLVPSEDPTLALEETPPLPVGAAPVPRDALTALTSLEQGHAGAALDDSPSTWWSTRRVQSPGQSFGVTLSEPRPVVALEIDNPLLLNHVPLSYQLEVALGNEAWRTVARRAPLRVPKDLVFSPKHFVFRVVLPEAVVADRVRISVVDPVPGVPFSVQELKLYERAPP